MLGSVSTRDRPPQPKRSAHITLEGAKKLRAELDQLWTKERPRVTQEVADAAAQGDRSENAGCARSIAAFASCRSGSTR